MTRFDRKNSKKDAEITIPDILIFLVMCALTWGLTVLAVRYLN